MEPRVRQDAESRPSTLDRGSWQTRLGVVALPSVVASLLLLARSAAVPLWRDEYATAMHASLSPGELLRAVVTGDAVQVPYYLLIHILSPILGFEYGMRIVSMVAVVVATALVALLAFRWWGALPGTLAGLFFATNVGVITAGVTARPYALMLAALTVAVLTADLASRRAVWWPVFTLASMLAVAMHLLAVLPIAATGLLALGRPRSYVVRWGAWTAAPILLALAVGAIGWTQRDQISWLGRPDLRSATASLAKAEGVSLHRAVTFDALGLVVLLTMAALLIVALRRRRPPASADTWRPVALGMALAFIAPGVVLVWSLVFSPLFHERYLVWASIGSALLLGATVWVARELDTALARISAACVLLLVAVSGVGAIMHFADPPQDYDDIPAITTAIEQSALPGDVVYVFEHNPHYGIAYAVAAALGDDAMADDVRGALVSGLSTATVRTVEEVEAVRSRAGASASADDRTVFIVGVAVTLPEDAEQVAAELGCVSDEDAEMVIIGGLQLVTMTCSPDR
ncbi:hypothetical protein GCM10022200_18220 [Microbacterium awajiense]|uniref:Glycosyltransferase RgtA/B/C/D-like domain-containing protein n=1 Tax=Microbacterium awajiense TaxID=415214 RepID=A0ABP7AM89_9MICO